METGTEVENLRTLTVGQLSKVTGIQVWRIHQIVAEGKGAPHLRVGRAIRFRVNDVTEWMEQLTNPAARERSPPQPYRCYLTSRSGS